jgi:hypothetical protein
MSSRSCGILEEEFERDRERHEARKRRVSTRRRRGMKNDPVDEFRRLRSARRRRLEDENYLDEEELYLGDDYDHDRLGGDDFFDRLERGSFEDYD